MWIRWIRIQIWIRIRNNAKLYVHPGFGSWFFTHPGSRIQGGGGPKRHRSRIRNTDFFCLSLSLTPSSDLWRSGVHDTLENFLPPEVWKTLLEGRRRSRQPKSRPLGPPLGGRPPRRPGGGRPPFTACRLCPLVCDSGLALGRHYILAHFQHQFFQVLFLKGIVH